ncbi:TPA: hypothetical protein ACSPZZ_003721 [Aeromonas hydrophila]
MPLRLLICCCLLCALPVQALTIAMVLWRGETDAERGFRDELNRLGHHPTFVTFNANQDRTVLATLLRQQLLPSLADYDYIYCFGTTATAMVKSLVGNRKPLIFSIVSDPVGAGFLSDDKTENQMVAGTISSYRALGQMAANIIHRNLQGTPLQDIPLQTDPAPRLVLGKQLAEIAPSAADH